MTLRTRSRQQRIEVEQGFHDAQFPLDIFQTGSGTSTNMNANEVIATLGRQAVLRQDSASERSRQSGTQSSNDVIPAAVHISAAREVQESSVAGRRSSYCDDPREGSALSTTS